MAMQYQAPAKYCGIMNSTLKQFLQVNSLKASGIKSDLIQRLEAHCPEITREEMLEIQAAVLAWRRD